MAYLVEVPVDGGGSLLVEVSEEDLPGRLEFAALRPGEIVARAGESLGQAIDQLGPAIRTIRDHLAAMSPDETTVEFGIILGAESGIVIAKGTTQVHFTVKLAWRRPGSEPSIGG
jgi:hypothetical protein